MTNMASELRLKAEKFNENKFNEAFDKELKHLFTVVNTAAENGLFFKTIILNSYYNDPSFLKRIIKTLEDNGFQCEKDRDITGEDFIKISW